jgi:hypothetical protein
VKDGQEFCGETCASLGGVNTEAVYDVNGFLVKATGIFVANGGDYLILFLDEEDDLVTGI